jgi:hypothetical protein
MRWAGWSLIALGIGSGCGPCVEPPPAADWRPPRALWQIDNADPHWAAIGADTVVFVDSGSQTAIAVDSTTGEKRWERAAPEIVAESLVASGDIAIFSQRSGITTAVGLADGVTRWSIDVGCALQQPTAGSGVVAGHCWSVDDVPGPYGIAAIDLATGARRWFLDSPPGIMAQLAHDDHAVYIASHDFDFGRVRAIDAASGRERWRALVPDEVTHAAIVDGVVIALGLHIHGLAADSGEILWQADRLDEDRPDPRDRQLLVHQRVVLRPRDGAIDGLDPRTGRVARTWTVPATVAGRRHKGLRFWSAGDALVAYVEYFEDVPGSLVVWRPDGAQVLPLPAGWISRVEDQLALLTDDEWVTTRALHLGPVAVPAIDPIPVVSAPRDEPEPECEWDDSLGAARKAHLEMGLPQAPYIRHRDALYVASDMVFRMELVGALRWLGIVGAPPDIAVDDDFIAGGDLRWLPVSGRSPRVLATGIDDISPVAFDTGYIYVVGRPRGGAAIRDLLAVPRGGGRPRRLLESDAPFQAIAAGEEQIFVAARDGEILAVGKKDGGPAHVAARAKPTHPCGETWRLDVVGDSLRWIGAYRPGARSGILWRLTPASR